MDFWTKKRLEGRRKEGKDEKREKKSKREGRKHPKRKGESECRSNSVVAEGAVIDVLMMKVKNNNNNKTTQSKQYNTYTQVCVYVYDECVQIVRGPKGE